MIPQEDIDLVRNLPRKRKRRIWKNWLKYRRKEIPGENRREKKENHRKLWKRLRIIN